MKLESVANIRCLITVWIAGLVVIFGSFSGATAQRRPPAPYNDRGACPFECCTYRQWTVDKPTVVRAAMRDKAPIAFRLTRGQRVIGVTGVVITTEPGIAEALQDRDEGDVRIAKGERIYLYTNQGEGWVKAWSRGQFFGAEVLDPEQYRIIRQPRSVWWVKIRNRQGKAGWSRQPENFGNIDQCG